MRGPRRERKVERERERMCVREGEIERGKRERDGKKGLVRIPVENKYLCCSCEELWQKPL